MKKYFLDANVVIDALVNRNVQATNIEELLQSRNDAKTYISVLSMHIIFYVLKVKYDSLVFKKICKFLGSTEIVPLTEDILVRSMGIGFKDFEDTLQYFSAIKDCDYILTRDKKDFENIKALAPSKVEIINKYHI